MNSLSNQLLSSPRFTFYQDTAFCGCNFFNQSENLLHSSTFAEQSPKFVRTGCAGFQFRDPTPHAQFPLDPFGRYQNLLHLKWLDDIVVRPFVYNIDGVIDIAECSDQDDKRRKTSPRLYLFQQADTIHARHFNITDNQVKLPLVQTFKSFGRRGSRRNPVPLLKENVLQKLAHVGVIINN